MADLDSFRTLYGSIEKIGMIVLIQTLTTKPGKRNIWILQMRMYLNGSRKFSDNMETRILNMHVLGT